MALTRNDDLVLEDLSAYTLGELLFDRPHVLVYRAVRNTDGLKVIVKCCPKQALSPRTRARWRFEYRVTSMWQQTALRLQHAVELIDARGVALVTTDMGGVSLKSLLNAGQKFDLETALQIGADAAAALGELHRLRIVHKDINPSNIVFRASDKQVELIDFGIASVLSQELQASDVPQLEGTLEYMSPEQTGRISALLDYRSDFYSLGATMYELLTGRPAFQEDDVSALLYAVLAKVPTPIPALNPAVPVAVANIITRLMDKDAGQRYQSAHGIQHDFDICLRAVRSGKRLEPFALGKEDRNERLRFSSHLYGREREIAVIGEAYKRCLQGHLQLLMVAGPSGIGKSALVNSLKLDMLRDGAIFVAGKYDQLRRHIPFSAFSHGIADLVRRILLEDSATIASWRERMQDALGNSGQILLDMVPSLELIIGPQRLVPDIAPQDAESRLLAVLVRFIQLLCPKQPLVVFLDDLQWGDSGTLKLLRTLALDKQQKVCILIVGAFRDNEVDAAHALMRLFTELDTEGVTLERVRVDGLQQKHVAAIIRNATHDRCDNVDALSQIVTQKTAGNPFFVHELLKHLYDRELLRVSDQAQWTWDAESIAAENITDNVVTLMASNLRELPAKSQEIISVCACLGADFTLSALAAVQDAPSDQVASLLQPILVVGFILPLHRDHRYVSDDSEAEMDVRYKFVHDRVQQAAYELLPADKVKACHYRIWQRLAPRYAGKPPAQWGV